MAVKNTLMDLSDTLFEQLERLNEADEDALESEVQHARAMCGVAGDDHRERQHGDGSHQVQAVRDELRRGSADAHGRRVT